MHCPQPSKAGSIIITITIQLRTFLFKEQVFCPRQSDSTAHALYLHLTDKGVTTHDTAEHPACVGALSAAGKPSFNHLQLIRNYKVKC